MKWTALQLNTGKILFGLAIVEEPLGGIKGRYIGRLINQFSGSAFHDK